MRKYVGAAGATVAAVVVAMTGLAGPAAAADKWTMPDVRGETLDKAIKDVRGVTGDVELDLRFVPRSVNQEVKNFTNWAVCATSPSSAREISQTSKRVIFSLRRLNEKC